MKSGIIIFVIVIIIIIYLLSSGICSLKCQESFFDAEDEKMGMKALQDLEDMLEKDIDIPEVTDDELQKVADSIYLMKVPEGKENLSYFPSENTRYWPYYYYSFPYNYKYGGAWPPGMFSRLYYWAPGFYTGSGLQYYMRPGLGYKYWPRNRWIRQTRNGNNSYYYVTNRDSYTHQGTADYSSLPLWHHS